MKYRLNLLFFQEYYAPVCEEDYIYEEPIYIKHRRRRHHHHHHHRRHPKCKQPQQPIIIPIPIQGPPEQAPVQLTEYVQDIYPPAQVYSEQVPVVCLSFKENHSN